VFPAVWQPLRDFFAPFRVEFMQLLIRPEPTEYKTHPSRKIPIHFAYLHAEFQVKLARLSFSFFFNTSGVASFASQHPILIAWTSVRN
jgi:hypothetical protein